MPSILVAMLFNHFQNQRNYHYIKTMTKFYKDWTINVTSKEFNCSHIFAKCPAPLTAKFFKGPKTFSSLAQVSLE